MKLVPESENGSPEDESELPPSGYDRSERWRSEDENAQAIWFALADELARNRSVEPDVELIAPWNFVTYDDLDALMSAYRQARRVTDQLRTTLAGLGLGDEFPGLAAALDADSRPVVTLGTVSVSAADRLATILRTLPPATGHRAA